MEQLDGIASESLQLIHPPSSYSLAGWSPSSVPVAIAPLEFDIQAHSFAEGFGAALSQLLRRRLSVAVRSRHGRLDILTRHVLESNDRPVPWSWADLRATWRRRVRPAAVGHERFFRTADAGTPAEAAAVLRDVVDRMTEVTFLHHTLILPARITIAEFCEFAVDSTVVDTELHALQLLAGRGNATTRMATHMWANRSRSSAIGPLAQEGDGYGLTLPGWLESNHVPRVLADLYNRCDGDRSPAALLAHTTRARRRALGRIKRSLATEPDTVRKRFTMLHECAQRAAWLTEGHAPLMHARLTYAMRQLVFRLGRHLVSMDMLDTPEDLLYLRIQEIREPDLRERATLRRAECAQFAPSAASDVTSPTGPDPLGSSPLARRVRRVFASTPSTAGRQPGVVGYPAAAGRARGPLRRVERETDLAKIEPGDVVLAAGNAAVWSYAAPAASAFLSASGSVFGHLASLARDYAVPCVLAATGLDGVHDGQRVDIDGETGVVSWEDRPA